MLIDISGVDTHGFASAVGGGDRNFVTDTLHHRLQAALDQTGGGRFIADSEDALFAAHQQARRDHDLPPLALHRGLALAARAHAADQTLRGYFAHLSPEGFAPADRVGILARTFVGLPGENIVDYRGSYLGVAPQVLMDSWMDSPGHRENILRPGYTHLGLGVVQVGRRTVSVASFGQRYAELEQPLPIDATGRDIARALETASPAIHSYNLTPVGGANWQGAFDADLSPSGLPPGPYTLMPRLQDGRRYTIVLGPIVEIAG